MGFEGYGGICQDYGGYGGMKAIGSSRFSKKSKSIVPLSPQTTFSPPTIPKKLSK